MKATYMNQPVVHPEGGKATHHSCPFYERIGSLQRVFYPCVTFLKLDPCVSFN